MKIFIRTTISIIIISVLLYNIWILAGVPERTTNFNKTIVTKEAIINIGVDSGLGNIVGIQPYLTAINYATIPSFKESLRVYLVAAKNQNLLNEKTVVVFPEYIGTWLVAYEEKESLYSKATINDAMVAMVSTNIFKFSFEYFSSPRVAEHKKYAAMAMKAKQAGIIYQDVFSELAKEFNITIQAGTIVLPNPSVSAEGKLIIKKGPLYNTAAVFNADGKIASPLVKKIYPTYEEQGYTYKGDESQTPIFTTPAGKLGVMIGEDSWYPTGYKNIGEDVKLMVVPALGSVDSTWNALWKGYNSFKTPKDVDTADIGKITEGAAWEKYSFGKRAVKAGIHYGMNVFFSGQIWDMKSEGRVLILNKDSLTVLPPSSTGRMVNLWLN